MGARAGVVLLEREPTLTGLTLLAYLQDNYPEHYDQRVYQIAIALDCEPAELLPSRNIPGLLEKDK